MRGIAPWQAGRAAPALAAAPLARQAVLRSVVKAPGRTVVVRAEKKSTYDVDTIVSDLQDKWENVEDKTTVTIYAAGALLALWVTSSVVSVFNSIPLLPKVFELVGLVYTSWFVYRYLLFKSSREELIRDVDALKDKITGE
eukprot:evm.model.scf_2003.5 EVM.evm.TU.scf_2003.5   scf_2003:25910-29797(-)